MKNIDELLGEGEVLRSMAHYQLLRPGTRVDSEGEIALSTGLIEIRVFKYLNGERTGECGAVVSTLTLRHQPCC